MTIFWAWLCLSVGAMFGWVLCSIFTVARYGEGKNYNVSYNHELSGECE